MSELSMEEVREKPCIDFHVHKEVSLPLTGFKALGTSLLNFWDGGQGEIDMYTIKFDRIPTEDELLEGVNDGGFGCESIEKADATLYAIYGDIYEEELEHFYFNKEQLKLVKEKRKLDAKGNRK